MKTNTVSFDQALSLIKKGGLVAIPTETVYGLAGSAQNKQALKTIFHTKKRPFFNPLIVHCWGAGHINQFHSVKDPLLQKMIQQFCPGPVTFILNKTPLISPLITAGHPKVGLRIPRHPLTLELIKQSGTALCAPSANIYGRLSPTCAEHVQDNFKGQVPILDGGPCPVGIESTVLEPLFETQQIKILRPGGISKEQIIKWLLKEQLSQWTVTIESQPFSPGQSPNHYQPPVPLVLITCPHDPTHPEKQNMLKKLSLLFPNKTLQELKLKKSPVLSARWLYHDLTQLSLNLEHVIYVYKTKSLSQKLWHACWDRLEKAASMKMNINQQI